MKKIITAASTIIYFVLMLSGLESKAQNFRILKDKYRQAPPKVILVELFTNQTRVKYYTKTGEKVKLEMAKMDTQKVIEKMVADFNDNFKFCPVYFFYDTNATAVREQKFAGVLLDKDLKPANDIMIQPGDTNYFVTYFGKLMPGDDEFPTWGSSDDVLMATNDNVLSDAPNLIVLDYKFQQLPKYVVRSAQGSGKMQQRARNYKYSSAKLNISYRARAAALSANFSKFYLG